MLSFWRFVTLVLAALALTMTSAHVLEMPQKMSYSAELYAAVNTTLYRYFAIVGGSYQIGGIISAWILTALLKKHPKPTDAQIDEAMSNICRCGTYQRIRAAIHLAAGNKQGEGSIIHMEGA